jgi:hypothetical protein
MHGREGDGVCGGWEWRQGLHGLKFPHLLLLEAFELGTFRLHARVEVRLQ